MMEKVPLSQPIKRGDSEIVEVTLRRPTPGDLRGLKLSGLTQMDVNTILTVLPRISSPALMPAECEAMDPMDFMMMSGVLVSFFLTPAQVAQAKALAEEELGLAAG